MVALLGVRQVGKSTLARDFIASERAKSTFFGLEDERELARLQEPRLTPDPLRGVVVLDEIHDLPEIPSGPASAC